jgi:hypothetical protein
MEAFKIGSDEHGRLLCRMFIETHRPFRAQDIVWPELDAESLARLKNLPVWDEAARTEAATAVKVQTLGETETDPILKEAIALQGYEEGRHAEIISLLTKRYGIATAPLARPRSRRTRRGPSCARATANASTPSSRSDSSTSAGGPSISTQT